MMAQAKLDQNEGHNYQSETGSVQEYASAHLAQLQEGVQEPCRLPCIL